MEVVNRKGENVGVNFFEFEVVGGDKINIVKDFVVIELVVKVIEMSC